METLAGVPSSQVGKTPENCICLSILVVPLRPTHLLPTKSFPSRTRGGLSLWHLKQLLLAFHKDLGSSQTDIHPTRHYPKYITCYRWSVQACTTLKQALRPGSSLSQPSAPFLATPARTLRWRTLKENLLQSNTAKN